MRPGHCVHFARVANDNAVLMQARYFQRRIDQRQTERCDLAGIAQHHDASNPGS
jgi:hypothetical protein